MPTPRIRIGTGLLHTCCSEMRPQVLRELIRLVDVEHDRVRLIDMQRDSVLGTREPRNDLLRILG